tara:strand:- start:847 stop:1029 length:183 start_codon:yes stop_codon:yes gene_type:complete
MNEPVYLKGPRIINGVNVDADIVASHPKVQNRQITDPVNDGSLGKPTYALGSRNKDNSPF